MKAVVQREGEGLVLDVMASRVSIRVRAEDTGGAFSVVEMDVSPGFQAPPVSHRHNDVDWYDAQKHRSTARLWRDVDNRSARILLRR